MASVGLSWLWPYAAWSPQPHVGPLLHRERIREKLGLKNDVELTRCALEHRLSE